MYLMTGIVSKKIVNAKEKMYVKKCTSLKSYGKAKHEKVTRPSRPVPGRDALATFS